MPPKFFITHSWKDIEFARRLCDDLNRNGLDGFLDAHSMSPGDSIPSRIERGLTECDVYIPVFSPEALKSDWCEWEIDMAITMNRTRKGRPRIIPVIAKPCDVPDRLMHLLYVSFVGRYDDALDELLTKGFSLTVGHPASPPAVKSTTVSGGLPWKNRLLPFGAVITLAIIALVAALALSSPPAATPTPQSIAGSTLTMPTAVPPMKNTEEPLKREQSRPVVTGTAITPARSPIIPSVILPSVMPTLSLSASNFRLAFESNRDGNNEIYVIKADGTNLRRLTNDPAWDGNPAWSPDTRFIAFETKRTGKEQVYLMTAEGTAPHALTTGPGSNGAPAWSPDGRLIAFHSNRDGDFQVYVMNSDGSNPRNLTKSRFRDWFPKWSPDGRFIVFRSNRDGKDKVYVMNADGSNPHSLISGSYEEWSSAWSPDGRYIAFESNRDGYWNLYLMNADGTNLHRLTNGLGMDLHPSWSMDNRFIAFQSNRDGRWAIYIIEVDTANLRRFMTSYGDDLAPSWSPQ